VQGSVGNCAVQYSPRLLFAEKIIGEGVKEEGQEGDYVSQHFFLIVLIQKGLTPTKRELSVQWRGGSRFLKEVDSDERNE
jgi:hypothetical protein